MSIAQAFLAEFEHEERTTRKFLERVPADKLAWKPHEKSMTAGQLALHIAASPAQVIQMACEDCVALPDFGAPNPQPGTVEEILRAWDKTIETVKRLLPTLDDARMQGMWSVHQDGRVIHSIPRMAFVRNILLNHTYHHRGQLGVYLRLLGATVPSSYGPSGDEMPELVPPGK